MDTNQIKELEKIAETVERETAPKSKQDRFKDEADSFWHLMKMGLDQSKTPPYVPDSRERSEWLRDYVRKDSILSGVVNSVIQIDRNRSWTLTGGRNQVMRFLPVFQEADETGWRDYVGKSAMDFYCTDMGALTEIGRRDRPDGPIARVWHADSTEARLTKKGLKFEGKAWPDNSYYRVVPMINPNQDYHGLGYCAVSRCLDLSRIMVGMIAHSDEKLRAALPKGFMTVYPITDAEWEKAKVDMAQRNLSAGTDFYSGVVTFRSEEREIKIDLTSLSQLPDGFQLDTWVQVIVSGFSLCFGYDVGEFWSPRSSGFSRGAEAEVQSAKATGKGEREFSLGLQEKLQSELPDSLAFSFDERDDRAHGVVADINKVIAETAKIMYEAGANNEEGPLLNKQQTKSWLVTQGVIPSEWTDMEEDIEVTDLQQERYKYRNSELAWRIADISPDEPIVRYTWPSRKIQVVFDRASEAVQRNYRGISIPQNRETLYDIGGVEITTEDVDAVVDETIAFGYDELAEMLQAEAYEGEGSE